MIENFEFDKIEFIKFDLTIEMILHNLFILYFISFYQIYFLLLIFF